MAHEWESIGIPREDLLVEGESHNTFQNAQFSAAPLTTQGFDRVVLVTSGVHLRRAMLYFGHFGVMPLPAPADHLTALRSPLPLSPNFAFLDIALHEYLGVWRYRLYEAMGRNAATTKAGAV